MRYLYFFFALLFGFTSYAQVTQEIFESFKLQERRDVHYYFPENLDETKKYPIIIDQIINEYSNMDVIEVEKLLYALKTQVNAIEAKIPIKTIYCHV